MMGPRQKPHEAAPMMKPEPQMPQSSFVTAKQEDTFLLNPYRPHFVVGMYHPELEKPL
jgi:hypothetical protein